MIPENLNGDSLRPNKRKPTDTSPNKRTSRKRENTKWKQQQDQKPRKQNTSNPGQNRSQTEPIKTEKKSNHARTPSSDTLRLTAAEAEDLARREAIIEHEAGGSHLRIGQELLGILEKKYHCKKGHNFSSKTIEEYALKRFGPKVGTSHRHVQRLLKLARAEIKIRKCPNGHLIPLDHEGSVRTLVERENKPDFDACVENVALMVETSNDAAKTTGTQPMPITNAKVMRAVNDAVKEHRIEQFHLRPTDPKELAADFHVSKVEDGLPFIADGAVDLVFTSFPYGCGISYTSNGVEVWDDKIPLSKLLDYYAKWLKVIERIANPDYGRICINIADIYGAYNIQAGEDVVYLDHEIDKLRKTHTDLKRHSKIIWDKGFHNAASTKHGSTASCSNPSIERQAEIILVYYRGSRQRPHEEDRNDMDNAEFMKVLKKNLWTVNAFCGQQVHEKHPCPFPVPLAENAIRLFTPPPGPKGEIATVCDPMGGIGSLAVAAVRHGRRFIHNDASQEYTEEAMSRVAKEVKRLNKGGAK